MGSRWPASTLMGSSSLSSDGLFPPLLRGGGGSGHGRQADRFIGEQQLWWWHVDGLSGPQMGSPGLSMDFVFVFFV
jgi:hypothetical protein